MKPRPTTRIAATVAAVALALGGCGSDDHSQGHSAAANLAAPPSDVHWDSFNGVSLPQGGDGPARRDGDSATGYSRTPQGAALAAIVHTVRMSLTGDDHWAAMAAVELAAGKGKDSWAVSRALLSIRIPADPATAPRIRGYTIADYGPERARVLIYTSFPDSSIAVNTATVAWVAQDWRLLLPDPSDAAPAVKAVGAVEAVVKLEAPQ